MNAKEFGIIQGGPYIGQRYEIVSHSPFPRWITVRLGNVRRDIPERFLEQESDELGRPTTSQSL